MALMHFIRLLLLKDSLKEQSKEEIKDPFNFAIKIVSIIILLAMGIGFGLMPYYIKKFRTNLKCVNISNAFSGGLFLGIALFHILPESTEALEKYKIPWAYFCTFLSYSLILFVEKVAFNSHSILHDHNEDSHQNFQQVQQDTIINDIEPLPEEIKEEGENHLIVKEKEEDFHDNKHGHNSILPYMLLLALGFHEIFEGMALGIQDDIKKTSFLALAIAGHEWASDLTLGVAILKNGIKFKKFFFMILIFAAIGPIGIALGLILSQTINETVKAIILSITVGTLIYVACNEVLAELFENPENKYIKFLMFILGGIFTSILSIIEAIAGIEE